MAGTYSYAVKWSDSSTCSSGDCLTGADAFNISLIVTGSQVTDSDGDGVADNNDNCPNVANPAQTDTDGDGIGDACDPTPNGDTDGDGVDNLADNCPTVANPDQADADSDGFGNACDLNSYAPAVATAATDANGNEGSTLNTSGAFSDQDGNSTLTITKLSGAGTVTDNGDGTWSWSLATSDNGSGSVTVEATDGEHAVVSDSFDWSASNVAPTVTSAAFAAQVQACGANSGLTINFTDPGTADTWTVDIDWGDGSTHTTGAITGGQSFSHSYGTGGPYTASVVVTDDDNGASSAFNSTNSAYGGYKSDGILQPINGTGPRSLFKYGSVIPVKLQLKDCNGNLVGAKTLYIRVQQLSGDTPSGVDEGTVSAGSANTGNLFRYDALAQQYIYNLSTRTLTADPTSSWRIFVDVLLDTNVIQSSLTTADFGLKK